MYEHVRSEIMAKLATRFPAEDIGLILSIIDRVMINYQVCEKETAIQLYDSSTHEAIKLYLLCRQAEGLQGGSLDNMRYTLFRFANSVGKGLADITTNDIRAYLYLYQQREKIMPASMNKIHERLNTFFRWCTNEGIIHVNPVDRVSKIKAPRSERRALTAEELEYCRNNCDTLREKALLEVFYSTGARLSEITNLDIKDIDWVKGSIRVFGKNREHYTVYLNAKARVNLKNYLKSRNDMCPALFVSERRPYRRLTNSYVRMAIESIGKRAGLDVVLSPHVLRHTMATMALQHGTPLEIVQKMLNHKSPTTTQIYAEMNNVDVAAAHRKAVI